MKHTIQQELHGIILFIGVIWGDFLLGYVMPFNILAFGITPRSIEGSIGIPLMPFLHANLRHIIGNTIPLFVLLTLLAGSRTRSWAIVLEIVFFSGLLLWLFGRHATHVGASGLVFGLIVFLVVSGLREGRIGPLMISILVGFLYGGALLSGIVPRFGSSLSWDGHLCGAIAGGTIGFVKTRKQPAEEAPAVESVP